MHSAAFVFVPVFFFIVIRKLEVSIFLSKLIKSVYHISDFSYLLTISTQNMNPRCLNPRCINPYLFFKFSHIDSVVNRFINQYLFVHDDLAVNRIVKVYFKVRLLNMYACLSGY
ncbi:hypothetical protein Hanom_Chr00s000001g01595501 [Helianthus anomalus]